MDDTYAQRYADGVRAAREGTFDAARIGDEAYVTGLSDERTRMVGERVTRRRATGDPPPPG